MEREEGERTRRENVKRTENLERRRERERETDVQGLGDSFLGKPGFPVISRG